MKKSILLTLSIFAIISCVNKNKEVTTKTIDNSNPLVTTKNNLGTEILYLENGITYLDLNNDDVKDMVVKGFRNNITAHSLSNYTFYISDKNFKKNNTAQWNIVSLKNTAKYSINTNEGADGILSDIFFMENSNGKYEMVEAVRAFGKSFADSEIVTFNYYSINFNKTENNYSYEVKIQKTTKQKYVDVREAVNKELSL